MRVMARLKCLYDNNTIEWFIVTRTQRVKIKQDSFDVTYKNVFYQFPKKEEKKHNYHIIF